MAESGTQVNFGVEHSLVVSGGSGTVYIGSFIKVIHPAEKKIVPQLFPTVPISMVHKANSESKKDNTETHENVRKELELLVTPFRCRNKSITVSREVILRQRERRWF